jgi:hypothetical protein
MDAELEEAYSVGRRNPAVPLFAGFEKEDKRKILTVFPTADYMVCSIECSLAQKEGVKLPEHTFYVDNLFSYQPLPYAKNLYYMDIDLYHYYLGREDQSVNEKVLMKRIDQQIRVTELVAKSVDLREVKKMYPKLAVYMMRNISIMLSISSIHLLLIKTEEAFQKRKRMWEQVKDYDRILYYRLRCSTLSGLTYLPGRLGGKITVGGYRMARKIYQFQ